MNEVILAVDGGATKTAVTVRKRDGTILFEGLGEGSNYQTTGADRVKEVLLALLIGVKRSLTRYTSRYRVVLCTGRY